MPSQPCSLHQGEDHLEDNNQQTTHDKINTTGTAFRLSKH